MPSTPNKYQLPSDNTEGIIDLRALHGYMTSTEVGLTPDQIRFCINMTLLAAHEARSLRPFMIDVINEVSTAHSLLGEVEGAVNFMMTLRNAGHPAEIMQEVITMKAKELTRLRYRLGDKLKLLMEVPPANATLS